MPTENTSLINPVSTFFNSTHNLCLFHAYQKLKTLNYLDLHREEKLKEIQENLECALEKYGKKIVKQDNEDRLTFLERTLNTLAHYKRFFTNGSSPAIHRTSETKTIAFQPSRNF